MAVSPRDEVITFECVGAQLVGLITPADDGGEIGVLVIVGGPQYRAGAHRQYVLLGRRLAAGGFSAMRFDCRGMGDSMGAPHSFEDSAPDVEAAITAFLAARPHLARVVLWGLCDAASAALLYWHVTTDARVAGMVLVNPWMSSDQSFAKAQIRQSAHRVLQADFWLKLARGGIDLRAALCAFAGAIAKACRRQPPGGDDGGGLLGRMSLALTRFTGPVLVVLSGRDLTAVQFREYTERDPAWQRLLARATVECRHLPDADHTFSNEACRQQIEAITLEWLKRSC